MSNRLSVVMIAKNAADLLPDCLGKRSIRFWSAQPFYKVVITASGYRKESTHHHHRILLPVTVNYFILCFRSHFLPVDRRKSRNSSFSMRRR